MHSSLASAASASSLPAASEEEDASDSVLSLPFGLSPHDPFYRTVVTACLVLCAAILRSDVVHSLMNDSIDPVDTLGAAVADPGRLHRRVAIWASVRSR